MPNFQILLVATQAFPSAARLSLRLKRYGADVKAVCPPKSKLANVYSVSTSYPFEGWNPLNSLRSAIDKSRPDFIIPTDDRAVWFLHELSESHPEYQGIVERSIGRAESFPVTRSRAKLLSLAVELGIDVPPTCRIGNRRELDECLRTMKVPLFLKKDGTWAGSGVRFISDVKDAAVTYQRLLRYPTFAVRLKQRLHISDPTAFTRLACLDTPEISAQALIKGVPATAMFACYEGEILGGVQARVIAARGKLGAALMIELIDDERISRAGSLLAGKLGTTGFFGLDFITEDETGIPYLIEMNPRCTQFGHIAVANKPDLAGLLWTRLTGNDVPQAGSADLGSYISFFPLALEYDPTSPFLSQSRFDVCLEDLEAITDLSKVKRSLKTWLRGTVREYARMLRSALRPAPASAIHYFGEYTGKVSAASEAPGLELGVTKTLRS